MKNEALVLNWHCIGRQSTYRLFSCLPVTFRPKQTKAYKGTVPMSNTSKGTAYEKFVRKLYQTLHDAEGFEGVKVEHNIVLTGKSGCAHQIDVYWEFRVAGQTHKVAIECKAFASSVPIGRVRDFQGVLIDVPGLQGIFASLFGYQSGAKKYAEHYGITLKEARAPTEDDWNGRVQNIHLRFFVITQKITDIRPNLTTAYRETLKPNEQVESTFFGKTDEAFVVDNQGNYVASVEDIRQSLPTAKTPAAGLEHTVPFPDSFLRSSNGLPLPIDGITVRYDVIVEVENAEILGAQIAEAIIKDVKSGEITLIDHEGGVRPVSR